MTLLRYVFAVAAIVLCAGCIGGRTPLPIGKAPGKVHTFHAIAPLSTSIAMSRRPTLTWDIAPGMDGAVVTVCADRACTNVIQTHDVVGTSVTLDVLPAGTYYWSLRTRAGSDAGSATTPVWQFSLEPTQATSGGARPGPFDADANGVPEIATGSATALSGEGRVDVFVDGQDFAPTTLAGISARGVGTSVASAVDVNGDGYGDLVVGARLADAASAYVYFGSANGLLANAPTQLHASSDAVAGLGDVNGDGYGDVLAGADLFLGSASGIATEPARTLASGAVPAAPGDVDGDGLADALIADIGAPHFVYFYRGDRDAPLDTLSWTLEGPVDSDFGASLASAGDINGDGFADVVIGAPKMNGGAGNAFAYLGNAGGLANSPAIILVYRDDGKGAFGSAVACVGDLDGDGFDEIAIGAKSAGPKPTALSGAVYLYRGGTHGVTDSAAQMIYAPTGAFNFGTAVHGVGPGALAIGAPGSSVQTGQVLIYTFSPGTGALVTQSSSLLPSPDPASATGFGAAIARAPRAITTHRRRG